MSQEDIAAQVIAYISGEMTGAEKGFFEHSMAQQPGLRAEVETLRSLWEDLGLLPEPQPSPALRARFYQQLNARVKQGSVSQAVWWKRPWVVQVMAACMIFALGIGVGQWGRPKVPATDVAQLRTQVEDLRQTVALSLMEKPSATSRLEGISWSSQVDRPDQELLSALTQTLNNDPNINVRLASLDALEKFTSDASVRKVLEQSIPVQKSPLVQIALIDALVHIHDESAAKELKQLSGDSAVNAAVRQRAQWGLQKLSFE